MPYNTVYELPWPDNLIYDFACSINRDRPKPEVINFTIVKHLMSYTTPRRLKALLYRYQNQVPYSEVAKIMGRVNHIKTLDMLQDLQAAGIIDNEAIANPSLSSGGASSLVNSAFRDMIYRYRWEQTAVSSPRRTIADLPLSKRYLNILRDNGIIYIDDAIRVFCNDDPEFDPYLIIDNLTPRMLHEIRGIVNAYQTMRRYRSDLDHIRSDPDFIIELEKELSTHGTNKTKQFTRPSSGIRSLSVPI